MNNKIQYDTNENRNYAKPETAMVLAAGLGNRMRPITNSIPKPLVNVFGKTLLDHGLDALAQTGVRKCLVNVHYMADQIEAHVAKRQFPKVAISDERNQLMDSGGGIAKALPELGDEPFYLLNADSFWVEGYKPNLRQLADFWRTEDMDILLLVTGTAAAVGYTSKGDFTMNALGQLTRRKERTAAPFAYAGAAIINPAIFKDAPSGPFNLNMLFDRAIQQQRLYGVRMEGLWLHVGTPDAIAEAEEAIAKSAA